MAAVESGLQEVQREPSEALPNVVQNNGAEIIPYHEPRLSESEWVISIQEKLGKVHQDEEACSLGKLSIHRFPHCLKNGEDKAWVPQIVSLGPYHHGKKHLHEMEWHKWRCLRRILHRTKHEIGLYLNKVKEVEKRARACYEGHISMSSNEFVEMMVLDGCFVIELFQGFVAEGKECRTSSIDPAFQGFVVKGFKELGYPSYDPVFSMWGSILQIQRDMIMLENQIPLFILDLLFGLQRGNPYLTGLVAELAIKFFDPLMPELYYHPEEDNIKIWNFRSLDKAHCLEVLWRNFLPYSFSLVPKTEPKRWSRSLGRLTRLILCLSKLQEAGIQISRGSPANSWGDIKFKNGILWIPPLAIHEGTKSLFLNLIAFEQSHHRCSNFATSYVIFMHNLINSPQDILHLCNYKIIEHCLGSDAEVVDLFHKLCQEVAFDINGSYLHDLSEHVKRYCRQKISWRASLMAKWNAWRAILKNKYFDNPWSIISFIAAVLLLVLTFLQALYAVYGYYRPRS